MGFYGNIRNTTSNSFKFDRVYSNRTLMEQNANSDGVFGGRYVLVEYDQALDENPVKGSKVVYKIKFRTGNNEDDYYVRYFTDIDPLTDTDPLPEAYTSASQDEQGKLNGDKVFYIKFIAKKRDNTIVNNGFTKEEFITEWCVGENDEYAGTVIYEKEYKKEGGNYTLYYTVGLNPAINVVRGVQIYDFDENKLKEYNETCYLYSYDYFVTQDTVKQSDKIYFVKDNGKFVKFDGVSFVSGVSYYEKRIDEVNSKKDIPRPTDTDAYTINAAIDRAVYGNGRGYDGTVWRKVFDEYGTAKYVNIAELNSVVPTFAVSGDAPSDYPQKPHYDKDSTNVYYNLHIQTPWGFRIADINDDGSLVKSQIFDNYDITDQNHKSDWWIGDKQHLPYTYDSTGHYVTGNVNPYYGAIFFNKDGFDPLISYHSPITNNQIRVDNYKSGQLYTNREAGEDEYDFDKKAYEDTKELSIVLPAIGNTIAHVWDVMYGDGENKYDKINNKYVKTNERQLDILWDDVNNVSDHREQRLHLVHDNYSFQKVEPEDYVVGGDYYELDDNNEYVPYEEDVYPDDEYLYEKTLYVPTDIETVAGAINSVHDLMGMIITKQPIPLKEEDGKLVVDVDSLNDWQIYYNKDRVVDENTNEVLLNENTYYYAAKTTGFETIKYPFENEEAQNQEDRLIRTAAQFKAYFDSDGASGYESIEKVKNIHDYVMDSGNEPIFARDQHDNIYRRVGSNITAAKPGGLYYNIPTKLQSVTAIMDPDDPKDWYYRLVGDDAIRTGNYVILPDQDQFVLVTEQERRDPEKIADIMESDTLYYWLDAKLGTENAKEIDNPEAPLKAYIIGRQDEIAFNKYRLKNPLGTDNAENRIYEYEDIPFGVFNKYQNGIIKSFDEFVEECGINPDGTKVVGNTTYYYNLDYIYYVTDDHAWVPDPEDPSKEIYGKRYGNCAVKDILFPTKGLDTVYYKKEYQDGRTIYTGAKWYLFFGLPDIDNDGILDGDQEIIGNLLDDTPYCYTLELTTLNNIGDKPCWYLTFDEETKYGQLASQALKIWGKDHPGDPFDLEDYISTVEDGQLVPPDPEDQQNKRYIDVLKSFNKHSSPGGFNWNRYQYFTADDDIEPWEVGYGLNSKLNKKYELILDSEKNAYKITEDEQKNPNKQYYIEQNENFVEYNSSWPEENKPDIYERIIKFFTDKIFYYNVNGVYMLASREKGYTHTDDNIIYRKNNEYYIEDRGSFINEFSPFEKLNTEIIREENDVENGINKDIELYFSTKYSPVEQQEFSSEKTYYELENQEFVPYDGNEWIHGLYERLDPLTIGYSYTEKRLQELYGFSRDINTMHGLLLRINDVLQTGDLKTRDRNTVQGCLNQLHDIIENFEELIPGELYGVNKYGKIDSVDLNSDNDSGESWVHLNTTLDEETGKTTLNVIHTTVDEFDRDPLIDGDNPDADRIAVLESYLSNLDSHIDADEKIHDPFGFIPDDTTGNRILLHSPVIDNAGHVVGEKETELMLSDLLLKTNGAATIGTLESPKGDVIISNADTLRQAFNKLVTHINAGADNITLNAYDDYYGDYPYILTEDTEPQNGKTYYIKDGNTFIVYNVNPWPDENRPDIYENVNDNNSVLDVDSGDNLNEAIAKLQWQLNHITNKKLTDLTLNQTSSTAPLGENDTLGNGLYKLQNRIYNIENFSIEGVTGNNSTGLTNIFAGIIRSDKSHVPTHLGTGDGLAADEMSVPKLRSGWIWVCHEDADTSAGTPEINYVYIKTKDGINVEVSGDSISRNYWELLNAWQ